MVAATYFLLRHGAHERGTLFLLRMTLNSGEWPATLEEVEGGVGVILQGWLVWLRCTICTGHSVAAWPSVVVALGTATYSIFRPGAPRRGFSGRGVRSLVVRWQSQIASGVQKA